MDEESRRAIEAILAADRQAAGDPTVTIDGSDSDIEVVEVLGATASGGARTKRRRRSGGPNAGFTAPGSGETRHQGGPSGVDIVHVTLSDLDRRFKLKACERTRMLVDVFSKGGVRELDRFRIAFERSRKKGAGEGTLWQLVEACWREGPGAGLVPCEDAGSALATGGGQGLPAEPAWSHSASSFSSSSLPSPPPQPPSPPPPHLEAVTADDDEGAGAGEPARRVAWERAVAYFQRRLRAMAGQPAFEAALLEAPRALQGLKSRGQEAQGQVGQGEDGGGPFSCEVECGICGEEAPLERGAFCQGGRQKEHFACQGCWWNFMTKSEGALRESTTAVPCFMPRGGGRGECLGLLGVSDARRLLGPLDALQADEKEFDKSRRVALHNGRRVFCPGCQRVVGVVGPEERGRGKLVACPTCPGRHFCVECGGEGHGARPCPPPRGLADFLTSNKEAKNTKRCPNCGVAVTKNGGCNHMTCAPSAGGCGHEWCWLCLGKFPRCDCGHFEAESEAAAVALLTADARRAGRGAGQWGRTRRF